MLKTIENLTKAFVGESQARNRYDMFAKIARKEGFMKIAEVFETTAKNEQEHAKWFFRMLQEVKKEETDDIEKMMVDAASDVRMGDTKANLMAAIEGEHEENSGLYPEFAKVAEDEGFPDIAARIRAIAKAEMHHEERFKAILESLEKNEMFKKPGKVYWVCMKCGYIHDGEEPPEKCPSCGHPRDYFELKCEKF
ncbi:MAG: rubrerythrin family protein [Candidatus Micrarchaeota archaeon]|nr:rubrerythrin family protein [Candidatus Micrarchaeota archaeon]